MNAINFPVNETAIFELNDSEIDFVSGGHEFQSDLFSIGGAIGVLGAAAASPFLIGFGAGFVIGAAIVHIAVS